MSNNQEKRGIAQFALFGAIGFGIGGIITGFGWGISEVMVGIGFFLTGALGGASLGFALNRKKKTLPIFGAIGFLAVFLFGYFTKWLAYESIYLTIFLIAAIPHLVGGIALGLAFYDCRTKLCLALSGIFGFVIVLGFFLGMLLFMIIGWYTSINTLIIGFIGGGIIGGASLGSVLGCLEKKGKLNEVV